MGFCRSDLTLIFRTSARADGTGFITLWYHKQATTFSLFLLFFLWPFLRPTFTPGFELRVTVFSPTTAISRLDPCLILPLAFTLPTVHFLIRSSVVTLILCFFLLFFPLFFSLFLCRLNVQALFRITPLFGNKSSYHLLRASTGGATHCEFSFLRHTIIARGVSEI